MKNLFKKNQLMITALAIMIAIAGYLQFAGTNLEDEYVNSTGEVDVDSDGVITENLTSDDLEDSFDLDSLLDLSDEDLENAQLSDIDSLDSDIDVELDDYLDEDMSVIQNDMQDNLTASNKEQEDDSQAASGPKEDEVPGEAVFTAADGVMVLSEAKLLKEQTRARNKETLMEIINSDGITEEQKQEAVSNMVKMTDIAEKEAAAEILLEAKGFSDAVVSINGDAVDVVVNAGELSEAQRAQIEDIVKRKTEIAPENIVISTIVMQE